MTKSYLVIDCSRFSTTQSQCNVILCEEDLEKLIHAFIFSVGLITVMQFSQVFLKKQLDSSHSSRMLLLLLEFELRRKKAEHITPVLRSLHWLPVCQRI